MLWAGPCNPGLLSEDYYTREIIYGSAAEVNGRLSYAACL
jgi:hypothetical protein